ncbi:hypothetical protein [Paenibacillus endoradicis]|uniref:hypothetical protein n=1 Tax=Paenibacillus endoradicis TaxID=2972487 RepID=UPI002158EE70|nr:hypothetical protein [Paenibacillus endoradicis]MCR8656164.1 hypothetical protein [Paenibacillus endoradicis]
MLTCQTIDPLPDLQLLLAFKVKRIELFVIPLIEIDECGFRACMCLTTNQGYGWSELFISEAQKPTSWNSWSATLPHFIGVGGLSETMQNDTNSNAKHFPIRQLFNSAVQHIHSIPNELAPHRATFTRDNNYNNALMDRSIFYLSLF